MEFYDIWNVKLAETDKCSECESSEWTQCPHCNGIGTMSDEEPCTVCSGKGKYCTNCAEIAHDETQQGQIDERRLSDSEAIEEELSRHPDSSLQVLYDEFKSLYP